MKKFTLNLFENCLLFIAAYFLTLNATAQDHSFNQVSGIYSGSIPCADCPGIQYRISLQRDGTFVETVLYEDKSSSPIISKGTYVVKENSILKLDGSNYSMGLFKILPSALQMLDVNGNEITGTLDNHYVLNKLTRSLKSETSNPEKIITAPLNRKKFSHGITFYATGNEPSWSLDIVEGKSISFTVLDGLTFITPFVKGVKAQDSNVRMFNSTTEAGTVSIQIQQQSCNYDMSGDNRDFKVSIDTKNPGDNEVQHFEGCGNNVPDFNLEGKWTLKQTGTKDAVAKDYPQGLPYFEINLDSFRYAGFAGCNRMTGKITSVERELIRFEDTVTMGACAEMNKESEFLEALKMTTQYKFLDNDLILSNTDKTTLVMSKASAFIPRYYRLIDIWVLESMNGIMVSPNDYRADLPRLEINSELNFTGTTGCNNISGTITADDYNIQMKVEKMTRMACNNSALETAFVDAINNTTSYSVADNRLTLMKDGRMMMVFRKVD